MRYSNIGIIHPNPPKNPPQNAINRNEVNMSENFYGEGEEDSSDCSPEANYDSECEYSERAPHTNEE